MIDEFNKWAKSLENCIKDELGPIPYFKYEEYGALYFESKESPFMVDYDKTPLFLIGRKGMNSWFFNKLRGKKTYTKGRGLGHLIFSLVHDFIHVYQLHKGNFSNHYDDWVEGLAQLYAIKICNKMYEEANPEDFSLLKKGDSRSMQEFITISLESRRYKKSILTRLVNQAVSDTRRLRGSKIIEKNESFFSDLSFEINQEIIRRSEKALAFPKKKYENLSKKDIQKDNYLWGAYQLNKIISRRIYTMKELIYTPLSNQELKQLSQDRKKNHSS